MSYFDRLVAGVQSISDEVFSGAESVAFVWSTDSCDFECEAYIDVQGPQIEKFMLAVSGDTACFTTGKTNGLL